MNERLTRVVRFCWRFSRNLVCAIPGGSKLLFPQAKLAESFGAGDAAYAIGVYLHHARQLANAGFTGGAQVFEIGPGRNLGSALLWWCRFIAEGKEAPSVTLWDVYANTDPLAGSYWKTMADALLAEIGRSAEPAPEFTAGMRAVLIGIAEGQRQPDISYIVCPMRALAGRLGSRRFDLVLSQASLEHVWQIALCWQLMAGFTASSGWHSHRIDLADHGQRESNYIEMLQWPGWAYWLTMRYIPGAINRWRASQHQTQSEQCGLRVVAAIRELSPKLPVHKDQIAKPYRYFSEDDLRCTAVDLVLHRDRS